MFIKFMLVWVILAVVVYFIIFLTDSKEKRNAGKLTARAVVAGVIAAAGVAFVMIINNISGV